MNKSGIYMIKCISTDKFYIGSSITLSARKSLHFWELRNNCHSNSKLQNAFNKYKETNFKFEVLEYCKQEKLIEREQFYLDSFQPQFNIRKIAEANYGLGRPVLQINPTSLEIINEFSSVKLASKNMNRKSACSVGLAIRTKELCSGFIWCYKDEYSKSFCEQVKQKKFHNFDFLKKEIVQVNKQGDILKEFDSLKQAAKQYNLPCQYISNVVRGKLKSIHGLIFKYKIAA